MFIILAKPLRIVPHSDPSLKSSGFLFVRNFFFRWDFFSTGNPTIRCAFPRSTLWHKLPPRVLFSGRLLSQRLTCRSWRRFTHYPPLDFSHKAISLLHCLLFTLFLISSPGIVVLRPFPPPAVVLFWRLVILLHLNPSGNILPSSKGLL